MSNENKHLYSFGPGLGKTRALQNLFRRRWWEFWKPRMPVIRPTWLLIPTFTPDDLRGYLTPLEVEAIVKHANSSATPQWLPTDQTSP